MIVEKIKSPGLAHLSYFLASESAAAVIDPRRDVEVYEQLARQHGARISHVLETHRNEDLISGAPILAERTGARVFHGPNANGSVCYAEITREGDRHQIGAARIEVLETPGHTDAKTATEHLARIDYDDVRGYVEGPMGAAAAAKPFGRVPLVDAATVERRLSSPESDWELLDVRALDEYRHGHIDGARHVYVGELLDSIGDLDKSRRYTVLCGSGARATIGASVLAANGFERVDVFLGSMLAWRADGRPVIEEPSSCANGRGED